MAAKFDMVNDLVLDNGLGLGLTIPGGSEVDLVGLNINTRSSNANIDLCKVNGSL